MNDINPKTEEHLSRLRLSDENKLSTGHLQHRPRKVRTSVFHPTSKMAETAAAAAHPRIFEGPQTGQWAYFHCITAIPSADAALTTPPKIDLDEQGLNDIHQRSPGYVLRPIVKRGRDDSAGYRFTRFVRKYCDREAGVNPAVAKSTRGLGNYTTSSTRCIGTTLTATTAQPDKWTFGASGRSSGCPEAGFAESGPPLLAQMRWHKAYRACERVEATI
ncbi:hypothetical protein F4823DRAFT_635249 [Ustulina deusta]|nr:hypothetical protein F4823DRAFT_635249 [Ustulina deusta]